MLARLWANQVIDGNKSFFDVPSKLQDAVSQLLIDNGFEELIGKH